MKQLFTWLLFLPALAAAQIPATEFRYKFDKPLSRTMLSEGALRQSPQTGSDIILAIPKDSSVKLLGAYDGYYRAIYQNDIGFLHFRYIDGDLKTFSKGDYAATRWRNQYDYENEPNELIRYGKLKDSAPIRANPSYSSPQIDSLKAETVIKVTHYSSTYWKVYQGGAVSYLGKAYLPEVYKTEQEARQTVEPTESDRTQDLIRYTNNIQREANRTQKKYSRPTYSSVTYHRGPRGGCYYITASGRKEYVDRSLCN